LVRKLPPLRFPELRRDILIGGDRRREETASFIGVGGVVLRGVFLGCGEKER
jgi:hypothetical protein